MFKFHFYCFASLIGVSLIIGKEAYINQQFYTTVVSLTTSKVGRVALYNAAIVLLFMFGQFLRWFFLGELKPREVEKAFEQTFYYVATTCLALTIFREHMNATILALFVLCLFIKVFHWLAQSRQEYIEQTEFQDEGGKLWEYARMFMLLATLGSVDITMSIWYIWTLLRNGPSVRLLLALEYLVMTTTFLTTLARLILHIVDDCNHHRWENKGKYKFYLEIFSDLLQCLLYTAFFLIILWFYGIPIHLVRELFVTLRSFKKTIADFIRYRKLITCLDERYPNATDEEIARDPQCIICYDDMTNQAKKLPCGHIFHKHCLKSWMERNNKCPYCNKQTLLDPPRTPVVQPQPAPAPVDAAEAGGGAADASSSRAAPGASKKPAKSKGQASKKLKVKQQLQEQLQLQQQQLQIYMDAWLHQVQPQAHIHGESSSTSASINSEAATPPPAKAPETALTPLDATDHTVQSSTAAAVESPPPVPLFAHQQQLRVQAGSGPQQLQIPHLSQSIPYAGQSQVAAPRTLAEAEAYREFHAQMAVHYEEMAATVRSIAGAYAALADRLRPPPPEAEAEPQ
eukprot:EG_transcript_6979